jgi:hypothetical protein
MSEFFILPRWLLYPWIFLKEAGRISKISKRKLGKLDTSLMRICDREMIGALETTKNFNATESQVPLKE